MNEPIVKTLSEITRLEWITWRWIELTDLFSDERTFVRGHLSTPNEAAEMVRNLNMVKLALENVSETGDDTQEKPNAHSDRD